MSAHVRLDTLPLFAPPPVSEPRVATAHDRAEVEHVAFLNRVRKILEGMFSGTDIRVTTDDVWEAMDRYGIHLPLGASPNLLGSFFSGWGRAQPVVDDEGKQRLQASARRGANGNLLRVWKVR